MNEEGYTLVEMLVALAIIGMTMSGLFEAVGVIGRLQTGAAAQLAESQGGRDWRNSLAALLEEAGPFRSDRRESFLGEPNGFSFDCAGASCTAALIRGPQGLRLKLTGRDGRPSSFRLLGASGAHFTYAGSQSVGEDWPLETPRPQVLRSISLLTDGAGEAPLATIRLWSEQQIDCEYDAISRECRNAPQ